MFKAEYPGGILITALGGTHRDLSEPQSHRITVRATAATSPPSERRWIFPTGAHHDIVHQKLKVKSLEATTFSKILSAKIILKLRTLGANILYFEITKIQFDPNHISSNQLTLSDSTKNGSINDSANIRAIENMSPSLLQLVHTTSPVLSKNINLWDSK